MVTRKEDTSKRVARRKYEEKNKEMRKEKNANFQTMIPRELFEEINTFLTEKGMDESGIYQKSLRNNEKRGLKRMLEVEMKAPEFPLPDKNGKLVSLSDFLGKKVVLYFYPKDNTPGWTRQACAFALKNKEI